MNSVERFWQIMRILATIGIIGQGLYYSLTQPGIMDTVNGCVGGVALYAIWFAREKKYVEHKKTPIQDFFEFNQDDLP